LSMSYPFISSPEFGEPDYNYPGPASLIVAVHMYPTRFSDETRKLTASMVQNIILMDTTTKPDSVADSAVTYTQS
jgi:hypothetical protein